MHWLVDEGVPRHLIEWLRERKDDVLDVAHSPHRGQPDRFLWQLAGREGRVLMTRDLGVLWPGLPPSPRGVVTLRVPDDWQAQEISGLVVESLFRMDPKTLISNVTVIEPGRVRQHPLAQITHR